MRNVTAIIYDREGRPEEVCKAATIPLPEPQANEAVVEMRFVPINPADLNAIEGKYPTRPDQFPATPGVEGVGVVSSVGTEVTAVKTGDVVLLPHRVGTWREAVVVPAQNLIPVPANVPLQQAAMAKINPPTAWRMLHDFVDLQPGDWVYQNVGNSGVGQAVIAICKAKGWRSCSVVRRPESRDALLAMGADVVLLEDEELPREKPRLALNAVGGESALKLANTLAHGGSLVTYGAMGRQPVKAPNGLLIFKDIAFRGFWVSAWYARSTPEQQREMFGALFPMIADGRIVGTVEHVYPLGEIKTALTRAAQPSRNGKILLGMS